MALLAMACFDTEENNRTWMTEETLISLGNTVNFAKHRLFVIDNASCKATKDLLKKYQDLMGFTLITNDKNMGTAGAINLAWKERSPGQNCLKIDNDVTIQQKGWLDILEEAIERDPMIGQCALKRVDLWETPWNENPYYRTELFMLPHKAGQRWIIGEKTNHCIGTCVLHSSALLDKVGYLFQPQVYGLEDSMMSIRSILAGFKNVFIPSIEISHIDPGGTEYIHEKERIAGASMSEYSRIVNGYKDGSISIYHNPFEK